MFTLDRLALVQYTDADIVGLSWSIAQASYLWEIKADYICLGLSTVKCTGVRSLLKKSSVKRHQWYFCFKRGVFILFPVGVE